MDATMMKDFPTGEVLSVVTGCLMSEIGGVYRVLNYMTGESPFTHQLPRVSKEATPVILECHPALRQACDEAEQVTTENYREWLATWEGRYGATISVPKMSHAEHERIDPISEAAEFFPPDRMHVITVGEKQHKPQ